MGQFEAASVKPVHQGLPLGLQLSFLCSPNDHEKEPKPVSRDMLMKLLVRCVSQQARHSQSAVYLVK